MRLACAAFILLSAVVGFSPGGERVTASPLQPGRLTSGARQVGQARSADLEEILVNGLRARTTEEKAFIGRVISLVDDGALSEGLVKALFRKARAYNSRFPMPYFVRIVRKVAAENGVDI